MLTIFLTQISILGSFILSVLATLTLKNRSHHQPLVCRPWHEVLCTESVNQICNKRVFCPAFNFNGSFGASDHDFHRNSRHCCYQLYPMQRNVYKCPVVSTLEKKRQMALNADAPIRSNCKLAMQRHEVHSIYNKRTNRSSPLHPEMITFPLWRNHLISSYPDNGVPILPSSFHISDIFPIYLIMRVSYISLFTVLRTRTSSIIWWIFFSSDHHVPKH